MCYWKREVPQKLQNLTSMNSKTLTKGMHNSTIDIRAPSETLESLESKGRLVKENKDHL